MVAKFHIDVDHRLGLFGCIGLGSCMDGDVHWLAATACLPAHVAFIMRNRNAKHLGMIFEQIHDNL